MNILLLLVDQMRYDALGTNGAGVCKTPALDALAAEGVAFDRAYTTCALCSPARASLVTGLYPHNHGQLANTGNFNAVFDKNPLGTPTYFSLLRQRGYQTGYAGKWHLAGEGDNAAWGIDEWHTTADYNGWLADAGIDYEMGKSEVQPLEWGGHAPFCGPSVLAEDKHHDGWVARRAVDMLARFAQSGRPFVMCAAFHGPHFPYAVPAPWHAMYDPALVPKWPNFDETFEHKPAVQQKELMRWNTAHLTWPDWQRVIATYWGYCSYIDSRVGLVLDALRAQGLADDTLVVFASDHGDMLGSHRLFNKGFNQYEEDYHIPLLARLPGAAANGGRCGKFVSLADLMPTFAEAGGADGRMADGRSLLPLLAGEKAEGREDVYAEFNGYETTLLTSRMVRTEKWKYIYNPFELDELYDMQSDPGELRNLAGMPAFSHVLRRMKARLVGWLRRTGDTIIDCNSWQSNSYGLVMSAREE